MIKTKTVLILGAGSSNCYQFPLGSTLCNLIYHNSSVLTNTEELAKLCIAREELVEFNKSFRYFAPYSIDEFLSVRTEFIDIGKKFIASALLPYEDEAKLFPPFDNSIKEDWYRYLLDRMMVETLEQFSQNNISFINFNYDRSLEQFLFRALKVRFNASDEDVASQINQLNIIHPHGTLGLLPWQSSQNDLVVNYMSDASPERVTTASKSIIIIHEAVENSPEFELAHILINDASRVFILGFGYHKDNLRRLKLPEGHPPTKLGTVKDLRKEDIGLIIHNSRSALGWSSLIDTSILELFKEVQRLE